MLLKRIEIFGFKSFADKTEIELSDGIIALLGPNGCGKSNIVDAIKWVLGEQSSKSLRSDKMEDLIFGGTEERKALNVAEVALTFEDHSGLPQLASSEVYVRRRIFRNGDSEYYLNNNAVKLRDLRDIFTDLGIGRGAYSIMEQGKIDQILSSKPENRRYIFEEAANIVKHRVKWQEADRKLAQTDENILQIKNILSEVKRSHAHLRKQSEKTGQYHKVKEEIFELERNTYLLRLKRYQEQKNKKEGEIATSATDREDIKREIDAINGYLEHNLAQVHTMEQALSDSTKRLYGLSIEKRNIAEHSSTLLERIQEVEERIQQDKSSERGIKQKCDVLADANVEKLKQVVDCTARIKKTEQNIAEFGERIDNTEKRVGANTAEVGGLENANRGMDAQLTDFQQQLQTLADGIVKELDERLQSTNTSLQEGAHTRLEESISRLIQLVRRQQQNLADLPSPAEKGELLFTLFNDSLEKLVAIHDEIAAGIQAYEQSLPRFLDDFLAPEGIITQKRKIDTTLLQLRAGIEENRQRMRVLSEENKKLNVNIVTYKATLQELLVNQERIRAEMRATQGESHNLLHRIQELKSQIQDNRQKIAEDEGRLQGLKKRSTELIKEKETIQDQEKHLRNELQNLEGKIAGQNKGLEKKEKDRRRRLELLAKAQGRHETNQMSLTEITTEIRNLYSNFREQYSRDLSEFEGMAVGEDMPTLKAQIRQRRESLRSLGSVNLMAIEEFADVDERHTFLSKQLQDLFTARQDLEQVTGQIREESERLFLESYEQIMINFNELFRRLFGGGRAEIRLLDPENILESGVEIYAQPPGKKLKTITLLSGGERSLTAVALIFAAYMLRPSPFCFLDEIDAALDESNIGRFVAMLADFAKTSQFIIITHNKKTVAAASTLLGVTMEEAGVSKSISIRLAGKEDAGKENAGKENAGKEDAGKEDAGKKNAGPANV